MAPRCNRGRAWERCRQRGASEIINRHRFTAFRSCRREKSAKAKTAWLKFSRSLSGKHFVVSWTSEDDDDELGNFGSHAEGRQKIFVKTRPRIPCEQRLV